jgi:hypothetical protein
MSDQVWKSLAKAAEKASAVGGGGGNAALKRNGLAFSRGLAHKVELILGVGFSYYGFRKPTLFNWRKNFIAIL